MMKPLVAFRDFANAPKMIQLFDVGSCWLYSQLITMFTAYMQPEALCRAFHNVFRDYKHLYEENQRTYFNGIVHSRRKTEKVFFFDN
jgi:hypothetical protein